MDAVFGEDENTGYKTVPLSSTDEHASFLPGPSHPPKSKTREGDVERKFEWMGIEDVQQEWEQEECWRKRGRRGVETRGGGR